MATGDGSISGADGSLILTEDMTGRPRGDSNPDGSAMPVIDAANGSYKNERTKIAVGRYGQDEGDAEPAAGLPVSMLRERWELERQSLLARRSIEADLRSRSAERSRLFRGVRTINEGRGNR